MSINNIIEGQQQDDNGNKIPRTVLAGEVSWFNSDPGDGFGRLILTNKRKLLARNYSCGYWVVLCGVDLSPYTTIGVTSGVLGLVGYLSGRFCLSYSPSSCNGDPYGSGSGSYSWNVTDPNTCTTYGATTNSGGQFNGGFSPGSTQTQGTIFSGSCQYSGWGTCNNSPLPNHFTVLTDEYDNPPVSCSGGLLVPKIRRIRYQVVDVNNTPLDLPMTMVEHFSSFSTNTCNNGNPQYTSVCTGGFVNGKVPDWITAGCNSVGGDCGYTAYSQQWQWCPDTGGVQTLASPGDDVVHHNMISVGGNFTGFAPGTQIYP